MNCINIVNIHTCTVHAIYISHTCTISYTELNVWCVLHLTIMKQILYKCSTCYLSYVIWYNYKDLVLDILIAL